MHPVEFHRRGQRRASSVLSCSQSASCSQLNWGLFSPSACVLLSRFSRVQLFVTLWSVAHQAPLSLGFPRQEYWSGLPLPSTEDLPDSQIKHASPTLQVNSLPLSHLPMQGTWDEGSVPGSGRSPGGGHGNSLQHSCWRTPRTEEPGGLESLRSQRVGHNRRDLACTHVPGKPHFTPELFNNPFCFCCQILSNLKVHSSLIFLQKEREIKYWISY